MIRPIKSLKAYNQQRSQNIISHYNDLQSMMSDINQIDAKLSTMNLNKNVNTSNPLKKSKKTNTLYQSSVFIKKSNRNPLEQINCFDYENSLKLQEQGLTSQLQNQGRFTYRQKNNIPALNLTKQFKLKKVSYLKQKQALLEKKTQKTVSKAKISQNITDGSSMNSKININQWKKKPSFYQKQNIDSQQQKKLSTKLKQKKSKSHQLTNQLHKQFLLNYKHDKKKAQTINRLFNELYQITE